MKNAFLFYYDHSKTGPLEDFYIRGLGVHERMPPGMIRHGNENYPWLFIYFHTPAVVQTESGPVRFNHSLTIWEPAKLHIYGNESSEWDHTWLIVNSSAVRPILESSRIPLNTPADADAGEIFEKYLPLLYSEINRSDSSLYLQERVLELFLWEINRTMKRPTQSIFLQIAHGVAHGMCVFACYQRLLCFFLSLGLQHCGSGIAEVVEGGVAGVTVIEG